MALTELFHAIEALPYATAMRESTVLFPTVETVHVFALSLVVGSIGMLDLRLLGVRSTDRSIAELATEVLPWTWASFALAVATGFLMFSAKAVTYSGNGPFRLKMCLLILAGVNMAAFHLTSYRSVRTWGVLAKPPAHARLAGGLSLFIWIFVIVAGRWIGFTT